MGYDFQTFFSAVVTGAAGVYVGMLTEDAGIATDLLIHPGQTVSVTGEGTLAPRWGTGGFEVGEYGQLSLTFVTIAGLLRVVQGGQLVLTSLALADAVFGPMLSNANFVNDGSSITFHAVTWADAPGLDAMDGEIAIQDAHQIATPQGFLGSRYGWQVTSGPCTVSPDGMCVGRPDGYGTS